MWQIDRVKGCIFNQYTYIYIKYAIFIPTIFNIPNIHFASKLKNL